MSEKQANPFWSEEDQKTHERVQNLQKELLAASEEAMRRLKMANEPGSGTPTTTEKKFVDSTAGKWTIGAAIGLTSGAAAGTAGYYAGRRIQDAAEALASSASDSVGSALGESASNALAEAAGSAIGSALGG